MAAFVDALGIGPAVVAGSSVGYPERTLGLVLVGSFATYRANPAEVEFGEAVRALDDPIAPDFVSGFQESTLAQPVPESFFGTVVAEGLKMPARVWRAAFEGFLEDDISEELGGIQAPTLIVW